VRALRLISQNLALLTLAGAVSAYFWPPAFLIFQDWFLWFFAVTMFALGMVLEPAELRETLRRPKSIALGVLAQYTIMPGLGFLTAWLSGADSDLALGFILVGCAPDAMAGNVIVYLAGGATAYSVAMTAATTFISPLVTPSLVLLLGGVFLPIPFWPMVRTVLLIVALPLAVGMFLRRFTEGARKIVQEAAPAVAVVSIVIICAFAVASNQKLISTMGISVLVWVIVLNLLGYVLGWLAARLYRFDNRYSIALAIDVGMQNAGLGVALALTHFGPRAALPGALFAVWCILSAAAATSLLRYRGRGKVGAECG